MQGIRVRSLVSTSFQHSSIERQPGTSFSATLPCSMAYDAIGSCRCQGVTLYTTSTSAISQTRFQLSGPANVFRGAGLRLSCSHFSCRSIRSWKRSAMATTSVPGIIAMRCTAPTPRDPTPTHATRTFFIGLSAKPCIGAPDGPKNLNGLLEQPAAIAATPIQAVPLRNSRLFVSFIFLSLFAFVKIYSQSARGLSGSTSRMGQTISLPSCCFSKS